MILTKKIAFTLLAAFLLQPLILLGIIRLQANGSSDFFQESIKLRDIGELNQSLRVLKEGEKVIFDKYDVKNSSELEIFANKSRQELRNSNELFLNNRRSNSNYLLALLSLEAIIFIAGAFLSLFWIFGKHVKRQDNTASILETR